jgi:GNAT superfamily N-acetyltransferase
MTVTLRLAGPDDEPFLYELYCDTRAEEMAAWGLDQAQQKAFLGLQFKARQRHYDIAFSGAEHKIILCDALPIGRILVYRSEREIRLVDIALLTEHRSKGIGASLIEALLEEATTTRKSVTLHVDKLSRAARLYERLGFSVIDDTGGSFKMEWQSEANQTTETK